MTSTSAISNIALKEWAVTIDTLAAGMQIMLLRKGGIHESDKDFELIYPEFVLFPTLEHQRPDLIKAEFRSMMDRREKSPNDHDDHINIDFFARVVDKFEIREPKELDMIKSHHLYTEEYALSRLKWRPKLPLSVAIVRIYKLNRTQSIARIPEYGGCKSWVPLAEFVDLDGSSPVLTDFAFNAKKEAIDHIFE